MLCYTLVWNLASRSSFNFKEARQRLIRTTKNNTPIDTETAEIQNDKKEHQRHILRLLYD